MLNRPVKHLQNPRMRKHPAEQLVGVGPVVRDRADGLYKLGCSIWNAGSSNGSAARSGPQLQGTMCGCPCRGTLVGIVDVCKVGCSGCGSLCSVPNYTPLNWCFKEINNCDGGCLSGLPRPLLPARKTLGCISSGCNEAADDVWIVKEIKFKKRKCPHDHFADDQLFDNARALFGMYFALCREGVISGQFRGLERQRGVCLR